MRERAPGADLLRRHAPEITFGALVALGAAIVLYETRGFSFYFDDWDFVLHRRGLSASVLLTPHGPHLSLVPILAYKLLLKVFGGSSFLPFRLLVAFDMVLLALVLGFVCRRAWGRWWGLVPVLLLVTLGTGGWTLLWSFQVGYAVATAAGVIALVALGAEWRHGNVVACAALLLALASGSQGIGFVVGAALIILLRGGVRRSAWVVLIPAVLYGLWYAKYGHQASETSLSLWRDALPYTMISLSSTISGLLGVSSPTSDLPPQLSPAFGEPIALAAIVLLIFALWRGWRPPRLFWGVVVTLIVLWVAAALSNLYGARRPTDSRYLPTDAMLLLIGVCITLPRPALRRVGAVVAVVALLIISATNAGQFTGIRNQMLTTDLDSRAQLGAMLIMRGLLPPGFSPAPPFSTGLANDVEAQPFFSAYDKFGLPVDSVSQLQSQNEGVRQVADGVLDRGEELGYAFTTAVGPTATAPPTVISGAATRDGSCLSLNGGYVGVNATPGTYAFIAGKNGSLTTSAGRFATTYDIQFGVVPSGRTAIVHVPRDRAPQVPWRFLVIGRGRVCT